jgi:hypothetical protein
MKIIVSTILFIFVGITTKAQPSNIYAMPKKANPTFSLIDTSNYFLLKKKKEKLSIDNLSFGNNKAGSYNSKNIMPCKKDFINVTAIPNACDKNTKTYAVAIPNASPVPFFKKELQTVVLKEEVGF